MSAKGSRAERAKHRTKELFANVTNASKSMNQFSQQSSKKGEGSRKKVSTSFNEKTASIGKTEPK